MRSGDDHLYPIDSRGELAEVWRCPVCPGGGDGFVLTLFQIRKGVAGKFCKLPVEVCARCWRNGNGKRTVAEL